MENDSNMQRDILVMNMEQALKDNVKEIFNKGIEDCTDSELYIGILEMTKELEAVTNPIESEKKIYYISAEFLIGKLLSNNLINLGIYDKLDGILKKYGHNLNTIEDVEPEPSLGNC